MKGNTPAGQQVGSTAPRTFASAGFAAVLAAVLVVASVAACFGLTVALLPASGWAFERTMTCIEGIPVSGGGCASGQQPVPIAWPTRCVSWRLNERLDPESAVGAAIRAAFDTWSDVPCAGLAFAYTGVTDQAEVGYDCSEGNVGRNINVVTLRKPWNDPATAARYRSDIVALTTVTFESRSGVILDADIELNGEHFDLGVVTTPGEQSQLMDVQNVMTHEVGHFLGLAHSRPESHIGDGDYRDATMFATTFRGETVRRELSEDDIAGVCTIYPIGDDADPATVCAPDEPAFVASPPGFDGASLDCSRRRGCSAAPCPSPCGQRAVASTPLWFRLLLAAAALWLVVVRRDGRRGAPA